MTTLNMMNPAFLPFPDGALRPWLPNETELWKAWCGINDPENLMYLMRRFPQSYKAQIEWRDRPASEKDVTLVIESRSEAIGTMGAHGIDWVNRTATTGSLIWEQKNWNRGIGTCAKMVFLNYLFNRLNLRIIYSHVIAFNGRSARYSDKCGYVEVGRLPQRFQFGTEYADELILMVTRETWEPKWEVFRKEHGILNLAETVMKHRPKKD